MHICRSGKAYWRSELGCLDLRSVHQLLSSTSFSGPTSQYSRLPGLIFYSGWLSNFYRKLSKLNTHRSQGYILSHAQPGESLFSPVSSIGSSCYTQTTSVLSLSSSIHVAGNMFGRLRRGRARRDGDASKRDSPYYQTVFVFDSEIRDLHMRKALESPGPFSPNGRTKREIIQARVISLFRLLLHYLVFRDQHDVFWPSVEKDFGWNITLCKTVSNLYMAARRAYLEQRVSDSVVLFSDRTSNLMCTVVDECRATDPHKSVDPLPMTAARQAYIRATRDSWKNYDPADLMMRAPATIPLPRNPDWLRGRFKFATSVATTREQSRENRAPRPFYHSRPRWRARRQAPG